MSTSPKVIFAGTPELASEALKAIVQAGFEVCMVLTQPDRPKGRGMKLQASAVKEQALALNLPIMQPTTLKDIDVQQALQALQADVMVVVAYGLILPTAVLETPRYGCLNIHASLLPRWRGAAPIQRAIEAGDTHSGVCIMQMDKGLDTGAIISEQKCPILPTDTAQDLYTKLTQIGASEIVAVLQHLDSVNIRPQSTEGVTYAHKITKESAQIDWNLSAQEIERKVRAFNPIPGAWTLLNGQLLKIWSSSVIDNSIHQKAGALIVHHDTLRVICGKQSVLQINELQLAGSKRMTAKAFLQGRTLPEHIQLGV